MRLLFLTLIFWSVGYFLPVLPLLPAALLAGVALLSFVWIILLRREDGPFTGYLPD